MFCQEEIIILLNFKVGFDIIFVEVNIIYLYAHMHYHIPIYIYIYIYLYNTQIIWDSNKFACTTKIFILISVFL